MADSIGRGSRGRRGWGSSRGSSARSSAVFDDTLYPGPYHGSQSLRSAVSRFSLNEQFAATRREYEFGYDDASSILERYSTLDEDQEDTVVLDDIPLPTPAGDVKSGQPRMLLTRTHYELLCLPQTTSLSPSEIRRAYFRLLQLLHTEGQPPNLGPVAASLFVSLQDAFETLIEPYRRINYDLSVTASSSDTDQFEEVEQIPDPGDKESYECRLLEEYLNLTRDEVQTSTDLGLRIGLVNHRLSLRQRPSNRKWRTAVPLDFGLRQSVTLGVPTLGGKVQSLATSARDVILPQELTAPRKHAIRCADPTVTVTGSIHGLMDEPFRQAPLFLDRYQPPGPSIHGRRRLEQLLLSRFLPSLNISLRQEFNWRELDHAVGETMPARRLPDTVIEQEMDILSDPAITTRIAHAVDLPDGGEPLDVEICVQKRMSGSDSAPSLGLAVHRRLGHGTAFVALDAGDWALRPAQECRHYSKFSQATRKIHQAVIPIRSEPTAEVGYIFSSYDLGLRAGKALTRPADRGTRAMDSDLDDDINGSWTVSLGATADVLAGYLRYSRDLFSSLSPSQSSLLPPGNHSHSGTGIRAEVEFSSTIPRQDVFLALRALKRIGRFTKVGFEVGISPSNLHFSLYWSRLNQRISLPLLLAAKPELTTELVFWTTVLPFIGFTAMEFLRWRPRPKKPTRNKIRQPPTREELQAYISLRRAEADKLTVLLASGVEPRQRIERQRGGLVILSAKYGVRSAPPDEVADVTVAVAALVDDTGRVFIPKGLRKSRILGFWDPAPGRTKVLRVRYLFQGKEGEVEVEGRGEVALP